MTVWKMAIVAAASGLVLAACGSSSSDGGTSACTPKGGTTSGTASQVVKLSSGELTVEVEHNISIAPRVPVALGDHVVVHGEYVWNAQGGLIHFTHHDPKGTHEAGYIQDNGKTYD